MARSSSRRSGAGDLTVRGMAVGPSRVWAAGDWGCRAGSVAFRDRGPDTRCGRDVETPAADDDEADLRIEPDESTADILALYAGARAAADQAVNDIDLDELGTAWTGEKVSMRWGAD